MRVSLIEDLSIVREGLAQLLAREQDLAVSSHAGVPAASADSIPDVVIVSGPPETEPLHAVVAQARSRFSSVPILALSRSDKPADVQSALAAGANGYITKRAEPKDLLEALRKVARGDHYLLPELGIALAKWRAETDDVMNRLTPRQRQVLRMIALGYTNAEIAKEFAVSRRTIETHRSHIAQQLGAERRADLVDVALKAGLLEHGAIEGR